MADLIQCPHCTASNHGAARFCNNCGGLLVQSVASAVPLSSPKKRGPQAWAVAVAVVLFLFLGFLFVSGIYKSTMNGGFFSNADQAPVKGWVSEHSETLAFQPGSLITGFQVDTFGFGYPARVRVDITAASPVTVAYFNSKLDDQVRQTPSAITLEGVAKCLRQNVLRNTIECELPPGPSYTLLILDERNMQSAVIAGAEAALGVKGPAEQALARNDVSLSLSSYRCVQNCRSY